MPKKLNKFFVSKEKAERTDSLSKALRLLHIELFRMLIHKDILRIEDVHQIFSKAFEQSSSREEATLQSMYELLTEPADSDDETDSQAEEQNPENE